jgi:hypothetical protein
LRATLSKSSAKPSGRHQLGQLAHKAGGSIERFALISTRQLGRRALFVLVNLFVDLLYGWLDPRIRLA